ncbi:MAG: glycosyltransferase family 4 protein [Armatimonadetes bacterium]|nr:glycosyltransferase family 4 protein [Armatimonadota bacterium]
MTRPLTIGVEATFLARDGRGMGRLMRNVLHAWQGRLNHRLLLLTRERRHLTELEEYRDEGWECMAYGDAPPLDVCWFPWMRVDWDPECPVVVMVHDTVPFTEYHESRHLETDQERLQEAVHRADRIVTISNFSRVEIHRHLDVELERIEVVPLGVDPTFSPVTDLELSAFPRTVVGPEPYLLYVGNTEPRKNLAGLLEAFTLMAGRIPHRLALVCERPRAPSWADRLRGKSSPLQRSIEEVEERLCWIERPEDRRLAELYRQCRLFVMPSFYEGFGFPLLEAMACGAPVAAARAASLPEVGGEVPVYFNPADPVDIARAIMEALGADRHVGEAGIERARQFPWSEAARKILEILEGVAVDGVSVPAP